LRRKALNARHPSQILIDAKQSALRYNQKLWKEEESGVSSWVTKPIGHKPSEERRHRHGAEDHNTDIIVKPYLGRLETLV
jgi:hypothetical protein